MCVCVVRAEFPDGSVQHFEGEQGAERIGARGVSRGNVQHYEGERDGERMVRVDAASGLKKETETRKKSLHTAGWRDGGWRALVWSFFSTLVCHVSASGWRAPPTSARAPHAPRMRASPVASVKERKKPENK